MTVSITYECTDCKLVDDVYQTQSTYRLREHMTRIHGVTLDDCEIKNVRLRDAKV